MKTTGILIKKVNNGYLIGLVKDNHWHGDQTVDIADTYIATTKKQVLNKIQELLTETMIEVEQ